MPASAGRVATDFLWQAGIATGIVAASAPRKSPENDGTLTAAAYERQASIGCRPPQKICSKLGEHFCHNGGAMTMSDTPSAMLAWMK
jgi:hypothetical protein